MNFFLYRIIIVLLTFLFILRFGWHRYKSCVILPLKRKLTICLVIKWDMTDKYMFSLHIGIYTFSCCEVITKGVWCQSLYVRMANGLEILRGLQFLMRIVCSIPCMCHFRLHSHSIYEIKYNSRESYAKWKCRILFN